MSSKQEIKFRRPWPFITPALSLPSAHLKCSGKALDMQPWPKPMVVSRLMKRPLRLRKNSLNHRVTSTEG